MIKRAFFSGLERVSNELASAVSASHRIGDLSGDEGTDTSSPLTRPASDLRDSRTSVKSRDANLAKFFFEKLDEELQPQGMFVFRVDDKTVVFASVGNSNDPEGHGVLAFFDDVHHIKVYDLEPLTGRVLPFENSLYSRFKARRRYLK